MKIRLTILITLLVFSCSRDVKKKIPPICKIEDYNIDLFIIKNNAEKFDKSYKEEKKDIVLDNIKLLLENKHINILTLIAVGDIIPHGMVKKTALLGEKDKEEFNFIFKEVKDDIEDADLAFANLETPYLPASKELAYKSIPYKFNIPLAMLKTIKDIGFDILNLANNHMYDQGIKGIYSTIKILKKLDFKFLGIGKNYPLAIKPLIIKRKGIKIGILSFTTWINNDRNKFDPKNPNKKFINRPYVNRYNPKVAMNSLKKLRKKVDFLIVSMHWGHEYHKDASYEQKKKAKLLLKYGADLILGHHPHVLQKGVLSKDKKLTIFSMGNFVSNQFFIVKNKHARHKNANREGVMWKISLKKDKKKIKIDKINTIPTYIKREFIKKNDMKNYRIYIHKAKKDEKEYKEIKKFLNI